MNRELELCGGMMGPMRRSGSRLSGILQCRRSDSTVGFIGSPGNAKPVIARRARPRWGHRIGVHDPRVHGNREPTIPRIASTSTAALRTMSGERSVGEPGSRRVRCQLCKRLCIAC